MPDIRLGTGDTTVSKSYNVLNLKEHSLVGGSAVLGNEASRQCLLYTVVQGLKKNHEN